MSLSNPWDPKDPNEIKDYDLDWGSVAGKKAFGDALTGSLWIIAARGDVTEVAPLVHDSDSSTATGTIIWLSGGTAGETYILTNRVTTAGGRTYDQSVKLKCKEL
jgi:hypothetical protein